MTNINTIYSSDGKYFIEGYGIDYSEQVSGMNPIKQLRIVKADSHDTVWYMDGPFLLLSPKPFTWSPDCSYVYIA